MVDQNPFKIIKKVKIGKIGLPQPIADILLSVQGDSNKNFEQFVQHLLVLGVHRQTELSNVSHVVEVVFDAIKYDKGHHTHTILFNYGKCPIQLLRFLLQSHGFPIKMVSADENILMKEFKLVHTNQDEMPAVEIEWGSSLFQSGLAPGSTELPLKLFIGPKSQIVVAGP